MKDKKIICYQDTEIKTRLESDNLNFSCEGVLECVREHLCLTGIFIFT